MNQQLSGLDASMAPAGETASTLDCDDSASVALHALWVGEHTAVYLARAMKAVVVRHGAAPLSEEDFDGAADMASQTCFDTGIRTVLIDFRAAPTGCTCELCESQGSPGPVVVAVAQDPGADTLARGLRNFRTFDAAMNFVRPKNLVPSNVPCPWGFERILATVQEEGGVLVSGNYAGAVFELPRHKAVFVHWSGDMSDEAAVHRVLDTADKCIARIGATHVILDHRDRVDLPEGLGKELTTRTLAPAIASITHAISIGEWPRSQGSAEEMIRPAVGSGWHISGVHSLKDALTAVCSASRARRDRDVKQAA